MTISIRLTSDEEARLDGLARRTGRSKSFYVRTALQAYLADLEHACAADAAIDAFESGCRSSHPLSTLKAQNDA